MLLGKPWYLAAVIVALASACVGAEENAPTPVLARDAIATIQVREGFQVELVAAEPLVVDPVAIDWGPDGKLWVVEMADYPLGIDGKGRPGGRVRVLEDTRGAGQFDRSTLFATGLPFPTGILCWGRGVLITAAPEIVYLEDSTGDGKADVRQVLFSGFLEGNQQLRVNGLRWGLDNWVYCASGSHHGGYGKDSQIRAHLTGEKVKIGSRDFRLQPALGAIDPQSGPSQYGRNRDDWGNWFGVQNSRPLWHYVLADHHIRRNPHFAPPNPKHQVVTPLNPPVYPASKLQKRFHSFEQSGRFTSACSAMIYRDDLLFVRGPEQHAFTCEPFHNLVQHNVITSDGVSFRAHRDVSEAEVDFFASRDRWCRPVMVRTGPDGALWVVDVYRYMIEHPQWLPQQGKDELRPWYRAGEDRGRIYKIVRKDREPRSVPNLSAASPRQLVGVLASPNGWQRDTAQRLLVDVLSVGHHERVVAMLTDLVTDSTAPLARLHALCTLDGAGRLSRATLEDALRDGHPGVRRNAVRIALRTKVDVRWLARMARDRDAKVRLELAATLGAYDDTLARETLAGMLLESREPYLGAAVISSLNPQNIHGVLANVLRLGEVQRAPLPASLIGPAVAMGGRETVALLVEAICAPQRNLSRSQQFTWLAAVLDGLQERGSLAGALPARIQRHLSRTIELARHAMNDASAPLDERIASVRLLGRDARSEDLQQLVGFLVPQSSPKLQQAILSHLASLDEPTIANHLLARWRSHTPSVRGQILETVARRAPWMETLAERLENGAVRPDELTPSLRQRLLRDAKDKVRWQRLLELQASPSRREVVDAFRPALQLDGSVSRGSALFKKHCIHCHKLQDAGHDVGPRLTSITDKSRESLLTAILDPNAAVDAQYFLYTVVLDDGLSVNGKLETETASHITLLAEGGKRHTILRRNIVALQASGKSLMPEGLEQELSKQDVADLLRLMRETFR